MTEAVIVECSIEIAATPEVIFPFLTDPEKLGTWLAARIDAAPRPGGHLRASGSTGDVLLCEFVEISPPRRLVMTWGWEHGGADLPPGASRVEWTLRGTGSSTVVTVRHYDLPPPLDESHEAGWLPTLANLKVVAEGGDAEHRCIGDPHHGCGAAG